MYERAHNYTTSEVREKLGKSKDVSTLTRGALLTLIDRRPHNDLEYSDNLSLTIMAALELGRRTYRVTGSRINSPGDCFKFLQGHGNEKQERFMVFSLNGAHEVIELRTISIGLVNRTIVHPREVFADAITDRACAVILAHNHPSGRLEPSPEDREITERLCSTGEIMGIAVLDHLVFSADGYFSFVEHGLMPLSKGL